MTQAKPTLQIRPDSSTPGIQGSHAHLIESLKGFRPDVLSPQASARELEIRSEQIGCTLRAVERYLIALMRDTADCTSYLDVQACRVEGMLDDLKGDLCGAVDRAAETTSEERAYYYRGRAA